ncbi:amino acid adenylation domain-containing protein [Streptomyces sp. LP05-1]|uniref:Amino acid adenylation domain-containing protein n=1 Tax=Streptomyces pyxinae TaxID=2970734 RepID=A0ABT2CQT6_9ACTN|nr:amino acid adenylation domain-containing protein [Streptomyces sp. LP05-1]MCS0639794.1 amino acid adenylation domain-containing protein [Streptomyces sp. LP05-1]
MLPALVQTHAKAHPNHPAVVVGQDCLTYAQLDVSVSRLARRLRWRGIGRGHLVGIHLDRTPAAVAALLAALATGAAYTVIDPTDPVSEGAGRLGAARTDLVLGAPPYLDELRRHGLEVLDVNENVPEDVPGGALEDAGPGEADTAYVLHTSGSTGVPKGVMVTHANIRHYTEALLNRLGITEPLRYAHVTTLAADLGNTCVFLALWTGGTLHLVDDATRRDPAGLLRYLEAERIDVLKTTPSHWSVLFQAHGLDDATRPRLRHLLLGGELLPVPLARRVLASGVTATLVNHYGPTEATVGVATHLLRTEADLDALGNAASVPIGGPLGANRLFVRTPDGVFHERGAIGDLYIAGPSVALGYRGNPEATAAAFTEELAALHPGLGRAYRTGDRVRADAHGVLEFLGRGDRQVKVRGHRVELDHVEVGLRRLPGVTGAVAMVLPGEQARLVAVVSAPGAGDRSAAFRTQVREVLPPYMVPDRIEVLDVFPRTSNGKTDQVELRRLVEARPAARGRGARADDDPLLAEVLAAWRRQLGHDDFGLDDDFTTIGGNSIDAIQVIADLQSRGHQVSAAAFLAEPTAAALATRLRAGAAGEVPGAADRPTGPFPAEDTALSPAQEWFFRQRFAQPDQWNQALLLDADRSVRQEVLAAAVADVVCLHPLLRTAFRPGPDGVRRVLTEAATRFSCSALPADAAEKGRHIEETAAACQRRIRIEDGTLFQAHLFRGTERAHLLLVAHHLCVDAVSWRILTGDLARCYGERLHGGTPALAPAPTDFGAWATHLRTQAPALAGDLSHWEGTGTPAPLPAGGANREDDAETVWFRLSRAQTDTLTRTAPARTGLPPHATLLGAFAQALAGARDTDEVMVDVESHGRLPLDDALDVSRVVGWFTSTFPVRVATVADDPAATGKAAAAALADVPRLGVAYGLHGLPQRTDLCFNYLGTLPLPQDDELRLTPSRHRPGPVRGPENDRRYALKLTARLHDGQLVADLSYPALTHDPGQLLDLARATRAYLLEAAGIPPENGQFVVEPGSTTGLLVQVPRALRCEQPAHGSGRRSSVREYGTVLLTGATGFLGPHLLHLLLTRTSGRVLCLVRDRDGCPAAERLREVLGWYLPDAHPDVYADRLTVLTGDLAEPGFGLPGGEYRRLAGEVDAIYHLAADTRLFGDLETFSRLNTEPVRAVVGLATTGRPKDLHHVSTLAVCGTGPEGEPAVFSEESLNIGQQFLNGYERSKYDAERIVHEFAAAGGAGFVYRSGNVSGHSVTGRFQRNGGDSRLVQLLRAAVRIGRVPRVDARTVALSPVDVVAEGILAISRSERVSGGTFHVDTHHELRYADLFAALRELGFVLEPDEAADFAPLFAGHLADGDEQIALAHFWASRPERNVRYDHGRTRRLLAHLDVEFPALDRAWLRDWLTGLIDQGELRFTRTHHQPTAQT